MKVAVLVALAIVAVASRGSASDVCTYNVRFTIGVFCPIHTGSKVCLKQTAAIGPCDENIRCFGGPGFFCQAELEPLSGPEPKCPLGSGTLQPRGLICYKPITAGPGRTATSTEPPVDTETPTFTPTATAIPTGTATATITATVPTATQTAQATNTATQVASPSATPVATATAIATTTQTVVATSTVTQAATVTRTLAATGTPTGTTAMLIGGRLRSHQSWWW